MFFEVDMRRLVVVQPEELGDALHTRRAMIRRLLQDFDALRCSEDHGYYVTVTTLENVSQGKIRPNTGSVVFWVDFKSIVFRPIRNEVVVAEVVEVNQSGLFADSGPAKIFVPRREMPGFEFRQEAIQEYNSWRALSGSSISVNTRLRLRILATRWDPKDRELRIAGTLKGHHLGHVTDDPLI